MNDKPPTTRRRGGRPCGGQRLIYVTGHPSRPLPSGAPAPRTRCQHPRGSWTAKGSSRNQSTSRFLRSCRVPGTWAMSRRLRGTHTFPGPCAWDQLPSAAASDETDTKENTQAKVGGRGDGCHVHAAFPATMPSDSRTATIGLAARCSPPSPFTGGKSTPPQLKSQSKGPSLGGLRIGFKLFCEPVIRADGTQQGASDETKHPALCAPNVSDTIRGRDHTPTGSRTGLRAPASGRLESPATRTQSRARPTLAIRSRSLLSAFLRSAESSRISLLRNLFWVLYPWRLSCWKRKPVDSHQLKADYST